MSGSKESMMLLPGYSRCGVIIITGPIGHIFYFHEWMCRITSQFSPIRANNGLKFVMCIGPHKRQTTCQDTQVAEPLKNITKVPLNASPLAEHWRINYSQRDIGCMFVTSSGGAVEKRGRKTRNIMPWDPIRWRVVWIKQDGRHIVTCSWLSCRNSWTAYQMIYVNNPIRRCVAITRIRWTICCYLHLAKLPEFVNSSPDNRYQ